MFPSPFINVLPFLWPCRWLYCLTLNNNQITTTLCTVWQLSKKNSSPFLSLRYKSSMDMKIEHWILFHKANKYTDLPSPQPRLLSQHPCQWSRHNITTTYDFCLSFFSEKGKWIKVETFVSVGITICILVLLSKSIQIFVPTLYI